MRDRNPLLVELICFQEGRLQLLLRYIREKGQTCDLHKWLKTQEDNDAQRSLLRETEGRSERMHGVTGA
jgi:hypothetical protein